MTLGQDPGNQRGWQFWIDRGGTFTDVVAQTPNGDIRVHKLLSDNPERYEDAPTQAIREILGIPEPEAIPNHLLDAVKMGTTVGTNALLERRGEPTVLAVTEGFRDLLEIGYQDRPDLFALNIVKRPPLYARVVEMPERLTVQGEVDSPLRAEDARHRLQEAYDAGFRAVAICLLHAYRFPQHEQQVARIAHEIGYTQISVSHQISPLMRAVGRGDTTVVDAYLSPLLGRYVQRVRDNLPASTRLLFMQSHGGLTDADRFRGKDSILSGPAGGIVGAVAVCRAEGYERLITFDMGGTSTDVAHFAGAYERTLETEVAGVRIRAPMMQIHTVAAGGGSVLHFDGQRFQVGPDSAGANPGPAAYRKGGPLTVTDCNILLGRIRAEHFPNLFGPTGDQPLDADCVRSRFHDLAHQVTVATGRPHTAEMVAEGFLAVAIENMAAAIKRISVQRGYDVTRYTLCCFGGAGGQHACQVADALGMDRVFLHPMAGVLSAYGMGHAVLRVLREQAVEQPLQPETVEALRPLMRRLEQDASEELRAQGVTGPLNMERRLQVRYQGTDTPLPVWGNTAESIRDHFTSMHRTRFGFALTKRPLVVEASEIEVSGGGLPPKAKPTQYNPAGSPPSPLEHVGIRFAGREWDTPVYERSRFGPGTRINGPAIIVESTATTVLAPGWGTEITSRLNMVLRRTEARPTRVAIGTEVDPVMLEIFNKRFMSVAEQMGETLRNTAQSVNIKERLDFSCAVFDRNGRLVANAPHIPVHLGSMMECVQTLMTSGDPMQPGEVYLNNSPYHGGTHLPDITVVTPVFDEAQREIQFYVASRGHHADVGGMTPGSMPPLSTDIRQEGVLAERLRIVHQGQFQEHEVRRWLSSSPHPARNPEQNIADLSAQIAANERGVLELRNMVSEFGLNTVWAYMDHVRNNAREAVQRAILDLQGGGYEYPTDTGSYIRVAVTIDRQHRRARIDFSGTSPQQDDNSNAPAAVCKAVVLYVFRTLVQDDIPLNSGCLEPLDIIIPESSMLNPRPPAAVVAGNVETSQHIADCLFGALGVLAGSQGTMNNFTFGNNAHQYYETICGGAGAGRNFNGADAVHSHMTNSRITDPEILEWRHPVLLESFCIREGSGGAGRQRGGNGVVRRIRFLESMTAAILSSHRSLPTPGREGGGQGAKGRNAVLRGNGQWEELPGRVQVDMQLGDVFVIETPGGGGFGRPQKENE